MQATPSEADWLQQALPPNSRVGVDPTLLSAPQFRKFNATLASNGSELVPIPQNLVDLVWAEARPARPTGQVVVLGQQYAGTTVAEKIVSIRAEMARKKCPAFVVSALDEVAWLFNLRGKDIPFNPVFFAYGLVTETEVVLYINQAKLPEGWAGSPTAALVTLRDYDGFVSDLSARQFDGTVWVGPSHSQVRGHHPTPHTTSPHHATLRHMTPHHTTRHPHGAPRHRPLPAAPFDVVGPVCGCNATEQTRTQQNTVSLGVPSKGHC